MPALVLAVALSAFTVVAAAQDPPREPLHVTFARVRDPGIVALLRHAQAPGVGDPDAFALHECATQRLLSPDGREQARRLGEVLRQAGVRQARIVSSPWCRCIDTARLLDLGSVEVAGFLGSFFTHGGARQQATSALRREILGKISSLLPTILVTHQVNITAVTDMFPEEGEMIFVRGTAAGAIEVVGRASLPR